MKATTISSVQWKKNSYSFMMLFIGFWTGVIVNYYGFLFEKIRINLNLNIIENSNSTNAAKIMLERWPHLLGNQSVLKNMRNGETFVVPNLVHFIWFSNNPQKEMSFLNYISILSAYKIQKPDVIMLHCNLLPFGKWWTELWKSVPIKIVYRDPPKSIHGQKIIHTYHQGDVAKMEVLMEFGGIYLDYDVVVVNNLNPLRKFDAVMGKEKPPKLIAGIIVASKNSLFLKFLHQSYSKNYRPLDWDYNCARVAYEIAIKRPDLIHIEPYKLTTPDWQDRKMLWNGIINWSELYVIHVMGHFDFNDHSPENIKRKNSTFGQVMRYIYYNSSDLIAS